VWSARKSPVGSRGGVDLLSHSRRTADSIGYLVDVEREPGAPDHEQAASLHSSHARRPSPARPDRRPPKPSKQAGSPAAQDATAVRRRAFLAVCEERG
jgi:hypothetical protein